MQEERESTPSLSDDNSIVIEYEDDEAPGGSEVTAARVRPGSSPEEGSIEGSIEDRADGTNSEAPPIESGSIEEDDDDDDGGHFGARGQVMAFEDLQVAAAIHTAAIHTPAIHTAVFPSLLH